MKERGIYEVAEEVVNAFYVDLVCSDIEKDVLDILELDICAELDRVLAKIKLYATKINN